MEEYFTWIKPWDLILDTEDLDSEEYWELLEWCVEPERYEEIADNDAELTAEEREDARAAYVEQQLELQPYDLGFTAYGAIAVRTGTGESEAWILSCTGDSIDGIDVRHVRTFASLLHAMDYARASGLVN